MELPWLYVTPPLSILLHDIAIPRHHRQLSLRTQSCIGWLESTPPFQQFLFHCHSREHLLPGTINPEHLQRGGQALKLSLTKNGTILGSRETEINISSLLTACKIGKLYMLYIDLKQPNSSRWSHKGDCCPKSCQHQCLVRIGTHAEGKLMSPWLWGCPHLENTWQNSLKIEKFSKKYLKNKKWQNSPSQELKVKFS